MLVCTKNQLTEQFFITLGWTRTNLEKCLIFSGKLRQVGYVMYVCIRNNHNPHFPVHKNFKSGWIITAVI